MWPKKRTVEQMVALKRAFVKEGNAYLSHTESELSSSAISARNAAIAASPRLILRRFVSGFSVRVLRTSGVGGSANGDIGNGSVRVALLLCCFSGGWCRER